jgi:type IV pilus assembly protein PilC
MPKFAWSGKNRYGDSVRGERVAASVDDLRRTLQKEQITSVSATRKASEINIGFLKRRKVKLKDLAIFSRQFSVLIDAELPLIQSLTILADQARTKHFKSVIIKVREDVEAGAALNQSLRKHPKVFDDLYCNLVSSGERSGTLDIMLKRLADYLERIAKLRAQIQQATIYPSAVLGFSILVVIFMMWKVIPVFATLFTELGATMPFLTRFVLALSAFVEKNILFVLIGIIALVFLVRYIRQTHSGRKAFDQMFLRMPLFGKLLEKVAFSRVTRTLSTLISGGVPMLESMRVTSTTSGNVIIENYILRARRLVAEGSSLNDALQEIGYFPLMLIQMVGVGEATGTLDEMLTKLADFYDDEVEAGVAALLSILEPVLLIMVGVIVGGIVVSMYLPLFSLIGQLG